MSVVYLVRHASHDWLGVGIAGRLPEVVLNERGRAEAEQLADALAQRAIEAVYSSPQPRALQTAEPAARALALEVQIAPEADELDFGAWQGLSFADLERNPDYLRFNEDRVRVAPPGGEALAAAQRRMVGLVDRVRRAHGACAVFGHNDPIKLAVAGVLGLPLEHFHRVTIDPASITALRWGPHGPHLWFSNRR